MRLGWWKRAFYQFWKKAIGYCVYGIIFPYSKKNVKRYKKNNLICNFVALKNYRIHIGILTLFCLVFFMMPSQSYACSKNSTKTEQSFCSKEKSKKSEHKKGCKSKSCKKCKSDKCRCGASTTSLNVPTVIELKAKNHLAAAKKQKFGFKEAYYSSGFFSIWLLPKII